MTTINSRAGSPLDIETDTERFTGGPGWVSLDMGRGQRFYRDTDLHAALGVADVKDVRAAEAAADEWRERAEKAEAKLDAVRARVEGMKSWGWQWKVADWARDLDAALNPPAPFTLPTEVPATIEAKIGGVRVTLGLWTDGKKLLWHDEADDYSPEQVMSDFTDHRIVTEEAGRGTD